MRELLATTVAVLASTYMTATVSHAGTLIDNFSSNPFQPGSERWCERWHDVSWNPNTGRMEAIGDNSCGAETSPLVGHSCCTTNCQQPDENLCSTVVTVGKLPSGNGLAGVLITEQSQEAVTSGNTRTVEVEFGLTTHLVNAGEHVAFFPVGHPNCHAGLQAVVYPDLTLGAPNYRMHIQFSDDEPNEPHNDPIEFPEFQVCGNLFGGTSVGTAAFALYPSTSPRYKLEVTSHPYAPTPGSILVSAVLFDTLPTPDVQLGATSYIVLAPDWYDEEAKRYVLGGAFTSTLAGPVEFDKFVGVAEPGGDSVLYVSFTTDTTVPGVGTVKDEDIVAYDEATYTWSLHFDGSDVGAGSDLNAFHIRDDGSILMSFDTSQSSLPGLSGTLDDSDIALFTPTQTGPDTAGSFSLHFDGSDVGLTTSSEDMDAIHESDPNDVLQISTTGNPSVTGVSAQDEDILEFTPTQLGTNTAGTWAMFCDASLCGFGDSSYEDINGISWDGGDLMFTTVGDYNASGSTGEDEDVSTLTATFPNPPSGTAALSHDLTALGIANSEEVDAIAYRLAGP